MNPLSTLFSDLREKRLLPVAALLLATAVAIPFVIGGGGSDSAASDPVVVPLPGGPVAAANPSVELVGPAAVRSRPGKVRDPFRRPKAKAKAASAQAASSSASTATQSSSSSSGSSGSSSSSGSSGSSDSNASQSTATAPPAPAPESAASKRARTVYLATARFKGAIHDYVHPLEMLDVFGEPDNPALMYAGIAAGGEYAIFLLGPNATASEADGACVVADPCRAIGLRKGEKLHVAVAFDGAAPRHYMLQLTGLRRTRKASAAAARRYRGHLDTLGRDVLKDISADPATAAALRQMRYSRRSGTVALLDAG